MTDSGDENGGVPLIEDLSDSASPAPQGSSKRKREGADSATAPTKKKAKKNKKTKKPKDVDDDALDMEAGVNHAIAHMDSKLMADHIAQRTNRFGPDLSMVETEDLHVPERAIVDTTSFTATRTTDQLPDFLEQFAGPRRKKKGKKLSDAPNAKGAPHTIIVTGAGLRAADLTRVMRKFQTKQSLVAKLFAKHIKLKEAVEMIQTKMGIGVGTPQRIMDLLENGALKATHLERIVVDASHIDQKKRGLLDMKETELPLVKLLSTPVLKEKYTDGDDTIELLFY